MASATITTKGQITMPKEIRKYLKVDTGSKVDFVIDENGEVKIIPLNVPAEALSGMLYRPGMKASTIEEMDEAIASCAAEMLGEGAIAQIAGCTETVTFDQKLREEKGFRCLI